MQAFNVGGGRGNDLNVHIPILIKKPLVVHLKCNWPDFSRRLVLEIKHWHKSTSQRLGYSHARYSSRRIDRSFNAVPFVYIEFLVPQCFKLPTATVVMAFTIIPVAAIGNLKLNARKRIQRLFSALRTRAKD